MGIRAFFRYFGQRQPATERRKSPWERFKTIKYEPGSSLGTPSRWIQVWPAHLPTAEFMQIHQWIPLRDVDTIELQIASDLPDSTTGCYKIVVLTSRARFFACPDDLLLEDALGCVNTLAKMVSRALV